MSVLLLPIYQYFEISYFPMKTAMHLTKCCDRAIKDCLSSHANILRKLHHEQNKIFKKAKTTEPVCTIC